MKNRKCVTYFNMTKNYALLILTSQTSKKRHNMTTKLASNQLRLININMTNL